jgi:hypothetical protein
MFRRIWNSPLLGVALVLLAALLIFGMWHGYQNGKHDAQSDCERIALRNNVSSDFCR